MSISAFASAREATLFAAVFCGTFGFVGLVFVCVALGLMRAENRRRLRCTAYAAAEVCAVERAKGSTLLIPVFRYSVNRHTLERPARTIGSTTSHYEGQRVDLYYDPENPNTFYVAGERRPERLIAMIFGGIGALFLLIALVALLAMQGIRGN